MAGDLSPALDEIQVRRIAAELAELGVFWLEEPLPGGDLDGMRALRGQIRVAGGEMARTPAELLDALAAGGPYVEFPYDPPGWTPERRDFFLTEPVRIDAEGCLVVPDAPGLGASIDHDAVARYALP